MTHLPNSIKLLVAAVVWRVEARSTAQTINDFDEAEVIELAKYHNVLPWLWCYVNEFSFGTPEFRRKVAEATRKANLINQLQTLELIGLSRVLSEQGVQHIVFKGVSIETMFYRGFIETRDCDDIDLLVSPNDLALANSILVSKQYLMRAPTDIEKLARLLRKAPSWYRWRDVGYQKSTNSRLKVDLHWRIADDFTLPAKTQSLLGQSMIVQANDASVPCLPFTTLFVYACVHAHSDYFFRLRYLVDLYCAMQQAEYSTEDVYTLADEWGVRHCVEAGIATVKAFFQDQGCADAYVKQVVKRYVDKQGFTERSHPNKRAWSAWDKWQYLKQQIRHRSRKRSWFSPILTRFKYTNEMLAHWPVSLSPTIAYPIALFMRVMKAGD